MSLENWGQMNKAQDDATTIDEAIASAISAHEADPESHMGEGESIENHRINEVIDHPQGSVVADKGQASQIYVPFLFDNITYWDIVASAYGQTSPGFYMLTTTANDNSAVFYVQENPLFKADSFQKNLLWQVTIQMDYGNNGDYEFGLGASIGESGIPGFRFGIANGVLTGYFNDGYTEETVALGSWVAGRIYTCRFFANFSTQKAEFWVDGVKIAEIDLTEVNDEEAHLTPLFMATKKRTTSQASMFIYYMLTSRDL